MRVALYSLKLRQGSIKETRGEKSAVKIPNFSLTSHHHRWITILVWGWMSRILERIPTWRNSRKMAWSTRSLTRISITLKVILWRQTWDLTAFQLGLPWLWITAGRSTCQRRGTWMNIKVKVFLRLRKSWTRAKPSKVSKTRLDRSMKQPSYRRYWIWSTVKRMMMTKLMF